MDDMENTYTTYLKRRLRNDISDDYDVLLDRLWRKEYYSVRPNDQNREADGIIQRKYFGIDPSIFGPCRVLEMLYALSLRMEYEITDTGYTTTYIDLFWEMVDNLGLLRFNNFTALKDARSLEIDHILTAWLDRKYSMTGHGGIFPLNNWTRGIHKPQNRVEIWYQMMLYLEENYPM